MTTTRNVSVLIPLSLALPVFGSCGGGGGDPAAGGTGDGIAVVMSDYKSSAVSLLDSSGKLVRDDCIDSGTRAPALSQALSGDVVLPSRPQAGHELLLIDRANAALTWVDPKTCAPVRQISVGTGFASNPHDVIAVGMAKAYVTRYARNDKATPEAGDFDDGDDLLIIDPAAARITGRIDLAPYAPDGGGATILPRADRGLLIEGKVYVTLAALSADYKAAASGRVVIIDPGTDTVIGKIDIPDRKSCGGLEYLAATRSLLITCGGSFSDGPKQADGVGVVTIDLAASPPAIKSVVASTAFGGRAVSGSVAAISDSQLFVVTFGEFAGPPPDQLWTVGVGAAAATRVVDGSAGFVFGGLLADPTRKRVYLSDGSMAAPRLRVFDASDAAGVKELEAFDPDPARGLPPRDASWY
jgi:hypothetical protein